MTAVHSSVHLEIERLQFRDRIFELGGTPTPHARLCCGARKHYAMWSVLRRIFWIAHNVLCKASYVGVIKFWGPHENGDPRVPIFTGKMGTPW